MLADLGFSDHAHYLAAFEAALDELAAQLRAAARAVKDEG